MHALSPVLRGYAWGSTDDIPRLLGIEPTGAPIAEAWWGAYAEASSTVEVDGEVLSLADVIRGAPRAMLGADAHHHWGDRLPYLLKVLAVERPLSIQVHPSLAQAQRGFAQDRLRDGGQPHSFLDPFHKPEMIVAVAPTVVLAGVRGLPQLAADLRALDTDSARALAADLDGATNIDAYIVAVMDGQADDALDALARVGGHAAHGTALRVAADALAKFPGDRGALVALALNVVQLSAGDGLYVGAGLLHSYQSGLVIEIMASSDNVVRAGLTPKPIDVPLLMRLAVTEPSEAGQPRERAQDDARLLSGDAEEFALSVISSGATRIGPGPRIVLCVRGDATATTASSSRTLRAGESLFLPAVAGEAEISADGLTVVAQVAPHDRS